MVRFPDVVLQLETLVISMVCRPLPTHIFYPAVPPDLHNLRLMRAVPGCFAADIWIVTCVNQE